MKHKEKQKNDEYLTIPSIFRDSTLLARKQELVPRYNLYVDSLDALHEKLYEELGSDYYKLDYQTTYETELLQGKQSAQTEISEIDRLLATSEEERTERHYKELLKTKKEARSDKDFQDIQNKFREMEGYKDSAALVTECEKQYHILKEQREAQEQRSREIEEQKNREEKRRKRRNRIIEVISKIALFPLAILVFVGLVNAHAASGAGRGAAVFLPLVIPILIIAFGWKIVDWFVSQKL